MFISMGWLLIRVPADDWKPAGWAPVPQPAGSLINARNVSARNVIKTPSSGYSPRWPGHG
jgi:hypothetical protein